MTQPLLDRILTSPRLPSLPTIALEVIDLVQQRDVDIKKIAHTIGHDPALASKILKTVNSSFYAQQHSISTISHALVVLGLNSVKTLALGFSLVANLQDQGGQAFDHVQFWKRSLYSATAAKAIARHARLVQQEEAFLGGLLQDLGMLAMNQTLGKQYSKLIDEAGGDHDRLFELERERLGLTHAQVGEALANKWKLPSLLIQPIAHHEEPDKAEETLRPLVKAVALGNEAADVFASNDPGDALETYFRLATDWFGISHDDAEPLLKRIHQQTNEMRRLFDLPTGDLGNADEILAQANDALMNLTLASQQQSSELQQRNKVLVKEATTDPLTNAANRRRFNEFLNDAFATCRSQGSPLSVVLLDADHFKNFNDTYGHPTGDRVLIELAATLQRNVQAPGLVARYGGEEFVLALPGLDRKAAALLAERVRRDIETTPVASDEGKQLSITASIGVATDPGGEHPAAFPGVDALVKAADRGVYAAKAGGRNCVRVFTPRVKKAA